MSDGIVALDPTAARTLAAAMAVARDAWRRDAERLLEVGTAAGLLTEVQTACAALADAAGDCDLAATDLEVRARLIEAIDAGDGAAQAQLSFEAAEWVSRWESAVSGGLDETHVTTTGTTGEDFLSRFLATDPRIGGPGVACYTLGYRYRGSLVGPDGRTYPLSTPTVDYSANGERRVVNADWGPAADGDDVWALDGWDPGWTTVAHEQGVGQLDGSVDAITFFIAGESGGTYVRSSGYTPASLAAHEQLVLDEYGVPMMVMGQPGGAINLVAGVDEVGAFTPVMTTSAAGHVRYEMTPTTRGTPLVGAAELVSLAADAGMSARLARDQQNYAYTVEYQEHPDGRRRAIPVVYHLAFDRDGDPVAFMGYLAPGADGALQAVPTAPRIHGDYQPAITINPES